MKRKHNGEVEGMPKKKSVSVGVPKISIEKPGTREKDVPKKKKKWKSRTVYRSSGQTSSSIGNKVDQVSSDMNVPVPQVVHSKRSRSSKTTSCMKHKRKDKTNKKREVTQTKNPDDNSVPIKKLELTLPKTDTDISVNWRELLQSDKSLRKKSKKIRRSDVKSKNTKSSNETSVPESVPEIWFDDVDDILLETKSAKKQETEPMGGSSSKTSQRKTQKEQDPLIKAESFKGVTKVVAMDCEMVGVGDAGKDSILARVSLVNQYGQCIYDKYVRPTEEVTDYRTHVSGIRRQDIENAEDYQTVQKEVSEILLGRVLVGHALQNDLKVLYLSHPKKKTRDTLRYRPFVALFNGRRPSLKKLSAKVLSVNVQEGEHSSVQDAQAAMRLYTMYRNQWERDLKEKATGSSKKK